MVSCLMFMTRQKKNKIYTQKRKRNDKHKYFFFYFSSNKLMRSSYNSWKRRCRSRSRSSCRATSSVKD